MSGLTKLVNDVYQGLYYYSVKYESVASAKTGLPFRLVVTFFFYYVSVVLLFIVARVKLYGPFRPHPLMVLLLVPGIYFIIYKYCIQARILESSFDDPPEERQRKVKFCLRVFRGSIAAFLLTVLVSYFAYKK